jgi:hypothetical protein
LLVFFGFPIYSESKRRVNKQSFDRIFLRIAGFMPVGCQLLQKRGVKVGAGDCPQRQQALPMELLLGCAEQRNPARFTGCAA